MRDSSGSSEATAPPRPTAPIRPRTAPLIVALVGCMLVLPLLVVPAVSRRSLSGLLWSIREGGSGMLVLLPLGMGLVTIVGFTAKLSRRALVRVIGHAFPVTLPLVAWGFYRVGMDSAFSAISDASLDASTQLRILAEGASETGNLLSLAAYLSVAVAFVAAVVAFSNASAESPRLVFGRTSAVAVALGLVGLFGGLLTAVQLSGESWHWLQGVLVVLFGTPLGLVAFAAIDGEKSGVPSHAVCAKALLGLVALCAALVAAYCAARNELVNLLFSACGGASIDPSLRQESLRASLASLAKLHVVYASLSAPLLFLLALLLVLSRGRALGPASVRDGVAVALAPLAVAVVVVLSPEPSWAFIQKTSAELQPQGFDLISTDRESLSRHDGLALYIDSSTVTVAGAGALQAVALEPIDDCDQRLARVLTSRSAEELLGPAVAISRDATLPGIRCAVVGTLRFRGYRNDGSEASPNAMPRFDSVNFDLILQRGPDASDLPRPFDEIAPHRGTSALEIAPRPTWSADRLHLARDAWRFHSEASGEQRFVGEQESRLAQLRAQLSSQRRTIEVSADPDVRAEFLIRALVLPAAARLVLEAPAPPEGLDGLKPVAPPPGAPGSAKIRIGSASLSDGLPAEVIHRITRQNFGRFRMCYEQGLGRNPALEGRVTVRFVIDRSGAVSNATNAGTDLADSEVVSCVIRAFYGLSFPQPEGRSVAVVYPITFSPG